MYINIYVQDYYVYRVVKDQEVAKNLTNCVSVDLGVDYGGSANWWWCPSLLRHANRFRGPIWHSEMFHMRKG